VASQTIEIVTCDRPGCRTPEDEVTTWIIGSPDGAVREVDLCRKHRGPVAEAVALGRPGTRVGARSAVVGRA
jgi:hypothetical protein